MTIIRRNEEILSFLVLLASQTGLDIGILQVATGQVNLGDASERDNHRPFANDDTKQFVVNCYPLCIRGRI